MEVRDDEVGVGDVDVDAERGQKRPVSPPIVNRPMKPKAYSIGVWNEIEPLYSVAVQLKTLIADGMATK